jgi:uncharacterized protein (DUF1015 family)
MPRIAPFAALTFDPAIVGALEEVTAPPYDVISEGQRERYAADPHSIVRVDLPHGAPGGPDRYEEAARTLDVWIREGALRREPPAYRAYEMSHAEGRVRGLLCALELEAWGGAVVPHERTMSAPLDDRLRLLRATRTHLSPVYGTIPGPCGRFDELLDRVATTAPTAELVDGQETRHRIWPVPAEAPVDRWLADEPFLIADGHHRYTTALTYRDERRAIDGAGPWDGILAFVVDAGSEPLPVRPFHRIQLAGPAPRPDHELPDLSSVLAELSDDDLRVGVATRGAGDVRFGIVRLPGEAPAVRALHATILDPSVGPDGLRFTPEVDQAVQAVRNGAVAAYLLPGTTTDRIRKVVERGERLPQKSTYFWPKPRTGMALMPLDPA